MFVEILLWYLLGVVLSYITMGIFNTLYEDFKIAWQFCLISYISLVPTTIVMLVFSLARAFEYLDGKEFIRYLQPEELFKLIKSKFKKQ